MRLKWIGYALSFVLVVAAAGYQFNLDTEAGATALERLSAFLAVKARECCCPLGVIGWPPAFARHGQSLPLMSGACGACARPFAWALPFRRIRLNRNPGHFKG